MQNQKKALLLKFKADKMKMAHVKANQKVEEK